LVLLQSPKPSRSDRPSARPAWRSDDGVKGAPFHLQIAFHKKCRNRNGSIKNRIVAFKNPHAELAGSGIRQQAARPSVDHETVVIDSTGRRFLDQLLVQDT
jgi:hypothetical protein